MTIACDIIHSDHDLEVVNPVEEENSDCDAVVSEVILWSN